MSQSSYELSVSIFLSLLSGFLGAIVGALLYGRIALRGILLQIQAASLQSDKAILEETIGSLVAVKSEIEHNIELTTAEYKQYFPCALSDRVWQAHLGNLRGIESQDGKILTDVYLLISKIKACDASIRPVPSFDASLPEYIEIEKLWKQLKQELQWARNVVEAAIDRNKRALVPLSQGFVSGGKR